MVAGRGLAVCWWHGALATLLVSLGVFIALAHPLSPVVLSLVFVAWCGVVFYQPATWPFVLPALLPVAGFSAWTGWLAVEEFDLLVLGAAAGSQARLASEPSCGAQSLDPRRFCLVGVALLFWLLALARGLLDAGSFGLGWYQSYEEPLNSLRVAKSLLFVALLLPSLRRLLQKSPALLARRLAAGVASGLALVSAAVVWERSGYPGLLDFSTPYRATALFWEMHVGGAALDSFLVLALPFAVYALRHAPTAGHWVLAALLAVIACYAALTSFSRAVYLGAAVALSVLAWALTPRRLAPGAYSSVAEAPPRWRVWAGRGLVLVLICESLAVFGLGDFMGRRLAASDHDLGGRLAHWSEGLSLLRGPSEFLLGKGLGRFPANYSRDVPGREIPARLRIVEQGDERHLALLGSGTPPRWAFELLQRVRLGAGDLSLEMDVRNAQPLRLNVAICHRHLLYDAACARAGLPAPGGDGGWQHLSHVLSVPESMAGSGPASGLGFLVLRPESAGNLVEIDNLSLRDAAGRELLRNGNFSAGLSHWFFGVRHHYLPWHIDSLFLETLLEQGATGLLLLLALLAMVFANLLCGAGRNHVLAPYLLAALSAGLAVGVFSSLLDMPRSAFLFFLLLSCGLVVDGRSTTSSTPPVVAPQNSEKNAARSIIVA
ncbi:O-antigen ligase [Accumulibacter sp.]|uniref:O-antigen ligase family protein n=1 Tax=Accumulibacter sp. TaxID=2053492 RepID=UPI002635746E|nr:O-antigen ligase family protein [Accumulibacter sp.]